MSVLCLRALCLLRRTPNASVRCSWLCVSTAHRQKAVPDVKLRLVQFECDEDKPGRVRLGAELGEGRVVDFNTGDADAMTCDMQEFLEHWEDSTAQAIKIIENAKCVLEPGQYRLKSPITRPDKIIGVAPFLFSKFSSSISDPGAPILLTEDTQHLDYEAEMAFVMCKMGKNIKESEAMSYVAGCTVANDITDRDWQMDKNQWLVGKTSDTHCPLGPALVTLGALSDPHNLGIRSYLNGELMQNSNTNQLIYKIPALIAFISRFVTLCPGDLVLTGTPLGIGCFKQPPVYMKKGDIIECEVDKIGKITNTVQ